jgi:Fe-S-cluster containining protein
MQMAMTCPSIGLSYGGQPSVRCSNCDICCKETMMELSSEDIEWIERKGYHLKEFSVINDGVTQLRNVDGYCYFYNRANKKCKIYEIRPVGCYLYPIVDLANEGAIVDDLCPMGQTISEQEFRTKEKILDKLLKKLDNERKH